MLRSASLLNTTIRRVVCTRYSSSVANRDIPQKWTTLSSAEQNTIAKQLEELQKGDWNQLAKDDKLACYYVAFGAHGPREPIHKEGNTARVFGGVGAVLTMSYILLYLARTNGQETPPTVTKEWEEHTNEYLKSQKSNPITGISSEGYKGTGYVTRT
ncbi:cytochrome c oxidase subunit IV [Absidia repens]|uniref:Cytochrome c oxidase subunit IV n=1 Tax=Absidia repens TaxID=90262 RepID=A0A1X2IRW2_9FUNG|nr:cytochrome c oxidase subunit IV [Absidia repens]